MPVNGGFYNHRLFLLIFPKLPENGLNTEVFKLGRIDLTQIKARERCRDKLTDKQPWQAITFANVCPVLLRVAEWKSGSLIDCPIFNVGFNNSFFLPSFDKLIILSWLSTVHIFVSFSSSDGCIYIVIQI